MPKSSFYFNGSTILEGPGRPEGTPGGPRDRAKGHPGRPKTAPGPFSEIPSGVATPGRNRRRHLEAKKKKAKKGKKKSERKSLGG